MGTKLSGKTRVSYRYGTTTINNLELYKAVWCNQCNVTGSVEVDTAWGEPKAETTQGHEIACLVVRRADRYKWLLTDVQAHTKRSPFEWGTYPF